MQHKVDWSCKHDILLRNPDGTLSPMDEPYFSAEQIAPGTWKILSAGDYSYLVEGEDEAVAIDTGYGAGNIREFLETLTDKPVRSVINTHSHFDHTAGNGYFDAAYMAEAALPLATVPYRSFSGIEFIRDYRRIPVADGFVYPLRGRELEIFLIPDHTPDGIAILDRAQRILFTGDEFMTRGKNLNVPLDVFRGYLQRLMAHRQEFDRLCAGAGVLSVELLEGYFACAEHIAAGNPGREVFVPAREGFVPELTPPVIYDRILPHPGDGGMGQPSPARTVREMEYAGVKISYPAMG